MEHKVMKEKSKVFISFLGTSPYLETVYKSDGKKYQTKFIQEALVKKLCVDWDENSRIVIFYTDGPNGSYKRNWEDNGQSKYPGWIGLKHVLEDLKNSGRLKATVEHDFISEGFDNEQVEVMFEKVYSYIQPGNEIYLDITHAFRSIPMFATTLLDYAHFMKKTTTKGVYYGAFEKLGPPNVVEEMPIDKRIAPIVDMTGIIKLQQYTRLAANLKEMGRTSGIGVNMKEGKDNKPLIKVAGKIDELDKNIIVNRSDKLAKGEFLKSVQEAKKSLESVKLSAPVKNLFDELLGLTSEFAIGKSNQNIEASIRWAHRYKMLPQAYTMGQEYIITLAMEKMKNICPYKKNNDNRQFVGSLIGIRKDSLEKHDFNGWLLGYGNLVLYAYSFEWVQELNRVYQNLTKKRIEIDHAKGGESFENLDDAFLDLFDNSLSIIKKADIINPYTLKDNKIIINLSNHPSNMWSQEQKNAAVNYGDIVDIPFPCIDESADEECIKEKVKEYYNIIKKYQENNEVVVHLMGEMSFTFALVHKLLVQGITCLASTTQRMVQDEADGTKITKFVFKRFREYGI